MTFALIPSEQSSGDTQIQGRITKTGNSRVRRLLLEAARHYMRKPVLGKVLQARRQGQPKWVIEQADKARKRLYSKYCQMERKGKNRKKIAVALARELAGFVWSILYPIAQGVERACIQCGQMLEETTNTESKFLEHLCPQCTQG